MTTTTADPVSSSVLPNPPVRPSDEATPESAEDFVKYFWQTYNYAYATYDTSRLEAISAPTCKFCASLIADVHRVENTGARVSGGDISVLESTSPTGGISDETIVVSSLR